MLTISQLAKQFKLSRSTLLHYDRIGLLRPSYRTFSNYRLYNAEEIDRLARICKYRKAGLSLEQIEEILETNEDQSIIEKALRQQIEVLNGTIKQALKQQEMILRLLQEENQHNTHMDKAKWIELLQESGLNDEDMNQWHKLFEKYNPQAHQQFLENLKINPSEIIQIRKRSKD